MSVLPPNLLLRAWREDDIPRIVEIESMSFPDPWSEDMFRDELTNDLCRCVVLVGGPDREILGFSLSWLVVNEIHLLVIATDPVWRRRGIARRLVEETERRGVAEGATLIDLEVRVSNHPARAFYRSLGFHEVGLRPRYYANREDAVLLRRFVGPTRPEAA